MLKSVQGNHTLYNPCSNSLLILNSPCVGGGGGGGGAENTFIFSKKIRIINSYAHIWNQHRKCSKMSTSKVVFGPAVLKILLFIFRNKTFTSLCGDELTYLVSNVQNQKCLE